MFFSFSLSSLKKMLLENIFLSVYVQFEMDTQAGSKHPNCSVCVGTCVCVCERVSVCVCARVFSV